MKQLPMDYRDTERGSEWLKQMIKESERRDAAKPKPKREREPGDDDEE